MTQPPSGAAAPATFHTASAANNAINAANAAGAATAATAPNSRAFGKIILTLENCLLPEAKLIETPSRLDGLDRQTEIDLRILGCELIQTAGILLKLPQVAMATGQVLFQRFYYSKSFVRHGMETTAMSCLCLASKIEEAPRRIRDVINVFHHIRQVRAQKPIIPIILDGAYIAHKTQIIKAERRVLKELGFCVHVKHPHKLVVMYLQVLGYEKNQRLMQSAWNYMNDSLRTDVFMRHPPETIASACIYLSARRLQLPMPNQPPWYSVFCVSEDDICDVAFRISELYRRPKPNVEALELAVDVLCKRHADARQRNRPGQGTPPTMQVLTGTAGAGASAAQQQAAVGQLAVPAVTTADRSNGSHNAWGGFISRALPAVIVTQPPPPSSLPPLSSLLVPAPAQALQLSTMVASAQQLSVGSAAAANAAQTGGATASASGAAAGQIDGGSENASRKRSLSPRSRSPRSRSPHQQYRRSNSPGAGGGGGGNNSRSGSVEHQQQTRSGKKSRHRSPTTAGSKYDKKKSSRNYSRSESSSPGGHGRHKKRDRKSPSGASRSNDKSTDYYANGSGGDRDRDRSRDHRDGNASRSNKDRSSGSGQGGRSDRERERSKHTGDRYGNSGSGSGGGRSSGTSSSTNNRSSGKHRDRSPRDRSRDRKR